MKQLAKRNATIALTMILMVSASTPSQAQVAKGVFKGVRASSLAAKGAAATLKGIEAQQRVRPATPNPPVIAPAPKLNIPVPALPRNNAKLVKAPKKGKSKDTRRPKKSK